MAPLFPYLVLYARRRSGKTELFTQPMAAPDPDSAINMAAAALVQQGLSDAMVLSALSPEHIDALSAQMQQVQEVIVASAQ